MIGAFRFLRTFQGSVKFADVSVASTPAARLEVSWAAGLDPLQRLYGGAVADGVGIAFDEHRRRGGTPHAVEVTALRESPADTTADAVKCAAAIACWKSWGHPESEATLVNVAGEWNVSFATGAKP